jgi:hypothetical protein
MRETDNGITRQHNRHPRPRALLGSGVVLLAWMDPKTAFPSLRRDITHSRASKSTKNAQKRARNVAKRVGIDRFDGHCTLPRKNVSGANLA